MSDSSAEKSNLDLETRYQKLASDFSKIRSHATVLKRALLEEQSKNAELKETVKIHEQQIRKHNQEMDSLMFRNEQLSKRITVLQQELIAGSSKKGKKLVTSQNSPQNSAIFDEELQKKIIENAQLQSQMSDKDVELANLREKNHILEVSSQKLQQNLLESERNCEIITSKLKLELKNQNGVQMNKTPSETVVKADSENVKYWQEQAEKWKSECELLNSTPNSKLSEYYEKKQREVLNLKDLCLGETKTLWAENTALSRQLENLSLEHEELKFLFENSKEESSVTTENYKSQLDAMTEHLAAQNDKIARQTDEIEMLRHKISSRK